MGLALLAAWAGFAAGSVAAAPARPNILLVTADDLGLVAGCYGDTTVRTPNLDALAARGTLFEHAYVAQASYSPSRSAIFTGRYPHDNGQYGLTNAGGGFQLRDGLLGQTIPALLGPAGYRTAIIGKLHVNPAAAFPFDERLTGGDTRDVRATAAACGKFLRQQRGPFFLMANFTDPHALGRNAEPGRHFDDQVKGIPEQPLAPGTAPPLPFQRIDAPEELARVSQYSNAVMRFDAGLGLLLDQLAADPWEFENLSDRPEHAATLAGLQAALLEWRTATADPLLTPEGYARVAAFEQAKKQPAARRLRPRAR